MLHVRMLSGEELTSMPLEEVRSVREVKQRLHELHGLPPHFRQRLIFRGASLDDDDKLDSPLELDLVLQAFSADCQTVDELAAAARAGSVDKVESLLRLPADPNLAPRTGLAPLMEACRAGHAEVARLLLEAGADKDSAHNLPPATAANLLCPDGISMSADTPLTAMMLAARGGHVEVVRLLMEAGVDKDVTTKGRRTALIFAATPGHVAVVRLLVEAGADKDAVNKNGHTALMIAAGRGHVDVARLLVQAGADMNVADKTGGTALTIATVEFKVEIARLLLEAGAGKDLADKAGRTALILAAREGIVAVVRSLMEAGANKDLADKKGRTALMWAAERGHDGVVRLLVEAGADTDLVDEGGDTAIMKGSRHAKVVQVLEEYETQRAHVQP